MPILTTDFPALTDDLQDIFNEVAKTSVAELVGNQIFEVRDTDRRTWDHLILHGMDVIRKVAQGADLPESTVVEGDSITYTQARYGGIVAVTKDMRLFDLYDQIDSLVRSATDDAFQKIDQSFADRLLAGFATTAYTDPYGESVTPASPDGVALFSASHTNNINGNVFRNLIRYNGNNNPVLSREAIVAARSDAKLYKDPTGHKRPINLDTLLVSPSKEDEAERILNSAQISGSMENDVNPLKGKVKLKVWEKLDSNSAGTDTSAFWFMYDSRKVGETLKAKFRERPTLDAPEQAYKSKNWNYSLDFYYAIGVGFPAYIWGSNGTGS